MSGKIRRQRSARSTSTYLLADANEPTRTNWGSASSCWLTAPLGGLGGDRLGRSPMWPQARGVTMRDMQRALPSAGPMHTIKSVASGRLSLAVGPLLVAYVAEGGWAGVFRHLTAEGR